MDCKVIISPRATQDLKEIVRYTSLNNPQVAEKLGFALIDTALSLASFPERGRFVPEFSDRWTREILYVPYRIIYRHDEARKAVLISRFWHAARGTPRMHEQ